MSGNPPASDVNTRRAAPYRILPLSAAGAPAQGGFSFCNVFFSISKAFIK